MKPTPRPSMLARARAWIGQPLGRGVLALCGLVVLSLVGRYAVAGGQVPPVATSGVTMDLPAPITSLTPITPVTAEADPVDAASAAPIAHARSASQDDPVYLNEATVDDLRRLPSIGEKRAMAILELRRKLGRFHQVEDLLRVKGIGRSTLRRLRPLVRVDHPAGDGGAP